jgi:hypothetical protein
MAALTFLFTDVEGSTRLARARSVTSSGAFCATCAASSPRRSRSILAA